MVKSKNQKNLKGRVALPNRDSIVIGTGGPSQKKRGDGERE
jgi:hypothetical protein